jgi:putative membrane protein
MMWHGFGWGGFGFGGGIFMIIFMVLVIGLIIWAFSGVGRRGCGVHYTGRSSDSLDIAAERYARGEISKDQFEQLKRDLR